ncbi:MAG TPA: hypothetical protein VKZ53_01520 [Candidatus Angelobacter sp.]|nr:hypothetical protein [Candidatus Angelobacter sp.]
MKRRPASLKKPQLEISGPKKSAQARKHHLLAEVTPEEKQAILGYCETHDLSVSRFLAQVALEDATTRKTAMREEPLTITLSLPANKRAKLLYMARLKEKTIDALVEEFLTPTLDKNRRGPGSRYTLQTEVLRYYLNDEEHSLIKRHMEKEHVSSRHYLAQLALKVIEKGAQRREAKEVKK